MKSRASDKKIDRFRQYCQCREEVMVQHINAGVGDEGLTEVSLFAEDILFINWYERLEYLKSEGLCQFRAEYFSELYGIALEKDDPFIIAMAEFEYALLIALKPTKHDMAEGQVVDGFGDFFKFSMPWLVGVEDKVGPSWLFEQPRTDVDISKGLQSSKCKILTMDSALESRYELLMDKVRIKDSVDECRPYFMPCCFCFGAGGLESAILDVFFAQKQRIDTRGIIRCLDEVGRTYRNLVCSFVDICAETSEGIELKAMETSPLLP